MAYKNPTPVAVALIQLRPVSQGFQMLAVRRGIEPFIGGLAFPGGYVNEGESAEEAISREFAEEAGLDIAPTMWKPERTLVTPGNQLLIFMTCRGVWIELKELQRYFTPNEEVTELVAVSSTDTLCFSLHDRVLKNFSYDT